MPFDIIVSPNSANIQEYSNSLIISDLLLSDANLIIFQYIVSSCICQSIDIFGTLTNIVNIMCFVKQGFKESINMTLCALAGADLICLVTLIFSNICFTPAFRELDLPFEPLGVQYLVAAWPHVFFTRVVSWITALITLERCLCITMPLKVNVMMSRRRTKIVIFVLYMVLVLSGMLVYFSNVLTWQYSPQRNRTILSMALVPSQAYLENIAFVLNNVINNSAFIVIITCTITIVITLRRKSNWRGKSVTSKQISTINNRDQKVARMVVMISTMFIMCFFPMCLLVIVMIFQPDLSVTGKYKNTFLAICETGTILESTNSAMNIFIYYHMSSKYRASFRHLFGLVTETESRGRRTTVICCFY